MINNDLAAWMLNKYQSNIKKQRNKTKTIDIQSLGQCHFAILFELIHLNWFYIL